MLRFALLPFYPLWVNMIIGKLPRKTILMDDRGRITVPDYMRKAMGMELRRGDSIPVTIEAYPNLEKCTALFIKKG